jgi:ferredoxin
LSRSVLIVGAGPAATGVALALSDHPDVEITMIDLGVRLEEDRRRILDAMSAQPPEEWNPIAIQAIAAQPVTFGRGGLPQKRSYGSDFPFRDVGQLAGLTAEAGANVSVVSGAFGGFSNVWGAQVMPFSEASLRAWPGGMPRMRPHYEAVSRHIPVAAEEDDLARMFPVIGPSTPLPPMSSRAARVLRDYSVHRRRLNADGVTIGKARLALDAARCVRCGLCMTGCPYSLIYSAEQSLDRLIGAGRITYRSGLQAIRVDERAGKATVVARELGTGRLMSFAADRAYVACGGVGTTRIIANSLRLFDRPIAMLESQQFLLPFVSRKGTADPRHEPQFTLNQFNMTIHPDGTDDDLSQLHFYTYNPAFSGALPRFLRVEPIHRQLLRRLSVALGYLPSWRAPELTLHIGPRGDESNLPAVRISRGSSPPGRSMIWPIVARLVRAAPLLDLYPVLPMLRLAAAGKSYHFGGSFPHAAAGESVDYVSDDLGRVRAWRRVHIVDGAVFPSVPATTFTLTVMANAHRIAAESIGLD